MFIGDRWASSNLAFDDFPFIDVHPQRRVLVTFSRPLVCGMLLKLSAVESSIWASTNQGVCGFVLQKINAGRISPGVNHSAPQLTVDKLRDIWQSSIQQGGTNNMTQIDILEGLNQMALDVIGLAGMWMFL